MAKIDLEAAYRSVGIHPDDYESTGIKWRFEGDSNASYMYDTRLPFGAKRAPGIFHRITQAVRRMMARRGYPDTIVYLDDWLVIAPTKQLCQEIMTILLRLLRSLGFSISYDKVVTPTTVLTFLGIQLDTINMSLTLPSEKVTDLKQLLQVFHSKRHATLKQLQSLAGRLNWASQVVRGGRAFLRRILNLTGNLQQARHRVKLDEDFFSDLDWWMTYFDRFHGKPISVDMSREYVTVESDSCGTGMGAVCQGDWLFADWEADIPELADKHINFKEASAVVIATRRWAHTWEGKHVEFLIDNQAAMHMINKGTTADADMMVILREMFWWAAECNFTYSASYLAGESNILADTASRLVKGNLLLQWALLSQIERNHSLYHFVLTLHTHIPSNSLLLLLPQIRQLGCWRRS